MDKSRLGGGTEAFLSWLSDWRESLEPKPLADIVEDPGRTAVMIVDMVVGFCEEGPLAGPRVAGLVPVVVDLLEECHGAGIRRFCLLQDSHSENAAEFESFGPHCAAGTREAETVGRIKALPFFDLFELIEKNSISSAIGTGLGTWLDSNGEVDSFIIVGDCTDLCVYQLAMHLRLEANAIGRPRKVIVPSDCVQTYDMPVDRAREIGVTPHDGDLLHVVFLYHMALNGIDVVAGVV